VNHTGRRGYNQRLARDQFLREGGWTHSSRDNPGRRYPIRRISSEVVVEGLEAEYCRGLNGEHRFDIFSEVEVTYQSAPLRRVVSQLQSGVGPPTDLTLRLGRD